MYILVLDTSIWDMLRLTASLLCGMEFSLELREFSLQIFPILYKYVSRVFCCTKELMLRQTSRKKAKFTH
jgi:hypothetical protein